MPVKMTLNVRMGIFKSGTALDVYGDDHTSQVFKELAS